MSKLSEEVKLPEVTVGSTMPKFVGHPSFRFLAKLPFFPHHLLVTLEIGLNPDHPQEHFHQGSAPIAWKEALILVCSH